MGKFKREIKGMSTQNFAGQDLRGRSFKGQDLTGADFSDCDIRGVDFSECDLRGVNFLGANLTGANFCRARMGGSYKCDGSWLFTLWCLSGLLNLFASVFFITQLKNILNMFGENFMSGGNIHFLEITALSAMLISIAVWWSLQGQMRFKLNSRMSTILVYTAVFTAVFSALSRPGTLVDVVAITIVGGVIIVGAVVVVGAMVLIGDLVIVGVIVGVVFGAIAGAVSVVGHEATVANESVAAAIINLVIIVFGIYLGRRASEREEEVLNLIYRLSRYFSVVLCTRFSRAILHDVDFSETDLQGANFRYSQLLGCRFQKAKNHHLALTYGTPLAPRKVRELVVNGVVTETDFHGLNLQGLVFSGLDLRGFNFANANVSFANFSGCDLREANLSEVTALGTRFNEAKMTGACIQNWNIDTRTELNQIRCDFVYLTDGKQQRNPPESDFAAGEFSKLYQQVADTIDFIVHSHAELSALVSAIDTVKTEAGNADIFVQNIERKDDSMIVKLKAPPEFDREQIYKEVRKEQKKEIKRLKLEHEQQLLNQRTEFKQEKDQLLGLLQTSLQRPVTVNNQLENILMKEDNSRSFSGNGNQNINLGDNSTLTQTIQHLPAEQGELKVLLLELQTLIAALPINDQQEALAETKKLAELSTQPKEEQQGTVRKTVRYFKGLAADLTALPEIGTKLGVLAAQIAALYCL